MSSCLVAVLLLLSASVNATDIVTSISPVKTAETIKTDGVLDEAIWKDLSQIDAFWQYFPTDSLAANEKTEVMMAYDDQFLYVAGICHTQGNDFVVSSLKRDYSFFGSDNITLMLDTYNDNTNAFVFGLNPFGVRREALVTGGGRQRGSFTMSWENKWKGNSTRQENSWTFEMAIPFSSLRYDENSKEWRMNVYRNDTQSNERSSWSRIPQNRIISDLTYMGKVEWDQIPKKSGSNISVIPYISGSTQRDFENTDQMKAVTNTAIGGDVKIGLTSALNLDLTFNPDFSQVEVDRQVTNLGRFEIFFPERRQFFLENADLFSGFGSSRQNPFFSRRIGVATDTTSGSTIQNQIDYGARLSGKVGENLRVGLLSMSTGQQVASGSPVFNYSVAALQQKIGSKSNVGVIFVNKQAINGDKESEVYNSYNRILGFDYNLNSKDNVWSGKAFAHFAITQDDVEDKYSTAVQLERQTVRTKYELFGNIIGQGFDAEVGFTPRKDIATISPEAEFFFYPKKGKINRYSLNFDFNAVYQIGKNDNEILDPWGLAEWEARAFMSFNMQNNSNYFVFASTEEVTLFNDFDPTRAQADDVFLPAGSTYQYSRFSVSYRSDPQKAFSYRINPSFGQFYNGMRTSFRVNANYRLKTLGSVSVDVDYNRIALAAPFEPTDLWLVSPRVDLTFSKSVFFATFLQYNNQSENVNINSRFQWRFAPASDLFLVYTDNYFTQDFSQFTSRNRALVLKMSYWLNV